jgi:mevalonate kinase
LKSTSSAPAKIILFGEHFVVYGIKAILASINMRVTVTSKTIPEKIFNVKSNLGEIIETAPIRIERINSPLKPFMYIISKMIEKYHYKGGGIEVVIDSKIPTGVGLGSSSACCVAAAASISGLFTKLTKEQILELAIEAERTIFPDTSGGDCTVCTYGGIMEYDKKNGFKKIDGDYDFQLIITNSKLVHHTDTVVSKVKKFKEENEEVFSSLCDNEEKIVTEVIDLLKNNELKKLGMYFSRNQEYLEKLGISNQNLNSIVQKADETSFGSKITGAGEGGCIISLVDKTNLEKTLKNLSEEYDSISVSIDSKGVAQDDI